MNNLFATVTIGDNDYKLRISASAAVQAEKKLGCSLARAWSKIDSVDVQVIILWAALQRFQHGITIEETMSLYDDFVDEGRGQEELADIFIEVYKCSGFMKREAPQEEIPENKEKKNQ